MAELYVAREGFRTSRRGRNVFVQPGDIAEEGSWPLEVAPTRFKPLEVAFPAPGSSRSSRHGSKSADSGDAGGSASGK